MGGSKIWQGSFLYLLVLKPCERKHSSEFTEYNYKNILSWVHVSYIYVSPRAGLSTRMDKKATDTNYIMYMFQSLLH